MRNRNTPGPAPKPASFLLRFLRGAILLLPAALLAAGAVRSNGIAALLLGLGALFQFLACGLAFVSRQGWREPVGPAVIMLYVIALSWMLMASVGRDDWFLHTCEATLLVTPLAFFAVQCLRESGAPTLRRARALASQLARRVEWPADLDACRLLPEVKALREALHVDAGPALELLTNLRPQVRVAALAALEFRQNWRYGQAELVLNAARRAIEPEIRAAAVYALANRDDREIVEGLAEFLYDPSHGVRQAATEALLWNTEHRWAWVRAAARRCLSDPACADDGPLRHEGRQLTAEAVSDMTAWAGEKGLLAVRAALTLGVHFGQVLAAGRDLDLVTKLIRDLTNPHTSAVLRLELARVLYQHRELDAEVMRRLLTVSTPAPVRLMAAEALLAEGASPEAVAALHDLARLPNREIALATADVVQRRLGVDLGLQRGQAAPPIHSRMAAEVARRVLAWASQQNGQAAETAGRMEEPAWRTAYEV
ncbi:MAG TPA: HEAT repeat domain-containing protein [Gemmataceae bacterium]|nr:HEAT repeat domain-containing protein [Gemmataceae bacterium]